MYKALYKSQWGGPIWSSLHTLTLLYPNKPTEDDKTTFSLHCETLTKMIPCKICKEHFKVRTKDLKKFLNSKDDLFRYFVDVHNDVNRSLKKPEMSYEEAVAKHSTKATGPSTDWISASFAIVFGVLTLVLLILLLTRRRGG